MENETRGMEIVELEPQPQPEGTTLGEALRDMDPSLAVEPVEDSESAESEAEPIAPAPGDEVEPEEPEELEDVAPGPLEDEPVEELVEDETEELEEEVGLEETAEGFTLRVDEVEIELEVEDDDTRAALEKMQNDLGRVKDVDELYGRVSNMANEVAANRDELDAIEQEIRLDPVGYIGERVHPTIKAMLLKEMLFDDELLKVAEDTIGEWLDDPASRREQAADAKVQRIERKREAQDARARQGQERKNAQAIWSKVMELTPEAMDHSTAKMWHRDAMAEIQQHVSRNDIDTLSPDDLPRILANRMRLYGIGGTGRKPAQPTDDRGKKLVDETGEKFRKKVARRRKVASSPTGAGGAPGRTQLPKGATLDDALKELRNRVGR